MGRYVAFSAVLSGGRLVRVEGLGWEAKDGQFTVRHGALVPMNLFLTRAEAAQWAKVLAEYAEDKK